MPIIYVKDKGGQTITYREVCGVRFTPVFPEDALPDIPKLKLRDDDVIIANWLRSGTHWMWEMVTMLTNNNLETVPKYKEEHMFEYQPVRILDTFPSPRIFNTHLKFSHMPEDLKTKRCKLIYLMRDPRDAMVSWYQVQVQHSPFEYKGEWRNWFPVMLEGKLDWGIWMDHVRDWEKVFETHPNLDVHVWHYEDMLKNPLQELRKVSEFLGTNTNESMLQAIVDKCHIDQMRKDKEKFEWQEDGNLHYKKGISGTWKELFTVEQYEEFEKMYREKMAGSKFENRYKGPVEVL